MEEFRVKGKGNDFHMIQNYVLQMLAEKKINNVAFVLYAFYQSLNGFNSIYCSYQYISKNTGLSKASISNANKLLEKTKLIKIKRNGPNKPNEIFIRPGRDLPRRELKRLDDRVEFEEEYKEIDEIFEEPFDDSLPDEQKEGCSQDKQPVYNINSEDDLSSLDERIQIEPNTDKELYRNRTTKGEETEKLKFLKSFKEYWCKIYNTDKYRIRDDDWVDKIDNYNLAKELIPVLWKLDDKDKWVRESNHSLRVFVKEYKNGNLQSLYPKTSDFYKAKNRKEFQTV